MKNLFLLLGLCVCFFSCTQDEIVKSDELKEFELLTTMDTTGVAVFKTWDEFHNSLNVDTENNDLTEYLKNSTSPISDINLQTRASIESKSVKGYSSITYRQKDYKVMFVGEIRKDMGLPVGQIWFVDYITAYKTLPAPNNSIFLSKDSPLCGYKPGSDDPIGKGYAYVSDNGNNKMFTYIICLKYDMTGKRYNWYYPRNLNDLVWEYELFYR